MKRRAKAILVAAGCIVVAVVGYALVRGSLSRRNVVNYLTRPVAYADISSSVTETGAVNPVNQVSIGSEVSGTVASVKADYNSIVRVGEVLATLDPTSFQAAVDSARASLRLANANLANAQNGVEKAKAQKAMSDLTLKRDEELLRQELIPQTQVDSDRMAATNAGLDYQSSLGAVDVAQTQVSVAEAQLEQAKYNLQRTIITSPIDGIVLSRSVSVGQSVAASLQAPTLFVLATSLSDMQVDAAVDEADVGAVKSGQPAEITVTAYPNVRFQGAVKEVRVEPTTVQNVVTYDAVISVHDSTGRLLPGMTAQVTVQTGARTHVPTVPIAALLYRPSALRSAATNQTRGGFATFGGGFRTPGGGRGGNGATELPVAGAPGSRVLVWVLRDGRPQPVQVTIGMSDERNVEITGGELRIGEEVVVAERTGSLPRTPGSSRTGQTGGRSAGGRAASPSGR